MRRLSMRLLAPVAALLLLAAAQVRADNISFTYSWTLPPGLAVTADSYSGGPLNPGHVNFQPTADGPLGITLFPATPSASLPAATLTTVTGASGSAPDMFVTNGHYQLTLNIVDGGQPGSITLGGTLGGSFYINGGIVTNVFDSLPQVLPANQGYLPGQFIVNNDLYSIIGESYTSPGIPGAAATGLSVTITAQSLGDGNITSKDAPEPSTMALSLFGLTSLGAGWWRKRRAAAA